MKIRSGSTLFLAAAALTLGACDDDDLTEPAEPATFEVTVANVTTAYEFPASGAFDTPLGATAAGPAFPGDIYEFTVHAAPGAKLSFATMFVQSNDWFYAPDGDGIALWDDMGNQVSGDVTDQILLWDSGTEEEQEPGVGTDQAPRQSGPDVGAADDDTMVRLATNTFGDIPATEDVINVTIQPVGETSFVVQIENVSDASTLMTSGGSVAIPLSPGAWVVHTGDDPLFTLGSDDRGEGLEAIAEDGSGAALAASLDDRTGIVGPISPGAFAVHSAPSALFMVGSEDAGIGLEGIAEDGDPAALGTSLEGLASIDASGVFSTPVGASAAAPAFPGESYTFEFEAEPGQKLSFATMYVQSNDLFFAPAEGGLELFPGGVALEGDVTGMILLWDAGTEVNERPGVGLNQAPRQSAADVGADENGVVRQVNDEFQYPDVSNVIEVTIRVIG